MKLSSLSLSLEQSVCAEERHAGQDTSGLVFSHTFSLDFYAISGTFGTQTV